MKLSDIEKAKVRPLQHDAVDVLKKIKIANAAIIESFEESEKLIKRKEAFRLMPESEKKDQAMEILDKNILKRQKWIDTALRINYQTTMENQSIMNEYAALSMEKKMGACQTPKEIMDVVAIHEENFALHDEVSNAVILGALMQKNKNEGKIYGAMVDPDLLCDIFRNASGWPQQIEAILEGALLSMPERNQADALDALNNATNGQKYIKELSQNLKITINRSGRLFSIAHPKNQGGKEL